MSEESLEVGINASGNFISVMEKAVKQTEKLANTFSDLLDLFKDANRAQGEFEAKTSKVAEATKKVATSSADAVSDVKKLKEALTKTGDEARDALKELDFSKISLTKLSTAEIEKLAALLREAGSNLHQFMEYGKTEDLDFSRALNQLNELRELAGEPLSLNIDFDSAGQVIAQLGKEVQQLFQEFQNIEASKGFNQRDFLVLQLDRTQQELNATTTRVEILRQKLSEIGPEASQGGGEAVAEFIRLKTKLKEAEAQAEKLGKELRDTFEYTFQQQNISMRNLGLKPLTVEDIFPTSEQQKIAQIRNKIDSAVRESVEAGAVQSTLNFFLNANNQISDMDRNIVRLTSTLPRLRYALYDVSNTLAIAGGALTGLSVAAGKVGIDFQRMFAEVERTISIDRATEAGRKQIQALERDLISLTQSIPVGFDEITRIATLAGQLNVPTGRIAEFTETVAKFVATSDVTVEAAATAFGRLDQLVAGVDGQFEKLGAAISAVGVNAVATESEIIAISSQIASVANIAGFGAGELVGFASALASVGTRPELARGTFTRLFTEINQAVAGSKDTLGDFARLAGMSAKDFQDAWGRGEGPELVIAFLRGLQAEGREAEAALRQVGITSVRDVPTLLKLAQGVEDVERQLTIAKIAFIEGTELQRQYSIVSSTVAEKLQVLKNSLQALIATIGSSVGSLGFLVDAFIGFFTVVQKILDNPVNRFIVGLTAAVVGLVGGIGLLLAALARAGAGFAGLLTASTETSKAIALTRLNVQGLNADLSATSATAGVASASLRGFGAAAATTGTASLTASSGAAVLSGGRSGFRLVTKTATEATKANKGLASSLFSVFKATKLSPLAALSLKIVGIYVGVLALVFAIDSLGKKFNWWGKEVEGVNNELGDLSPFLSAVKRDTDDFNRGITDAADGLIFFRGEVSDSNVELSERGKVVAIVTGQEELLEKAVDGSSTAIKGQTLVIGENTLALIKQKIAQDVINDSQEISLKRVQELIRANKLLTDASRPGAVGVDVNALSEMRRQVSEQGAAAGVASVFAIVSDPRLNEALKEAGFNVSEFFDLIARRNVDAATSLLNNLVPAAEELREALLNSGMSETSDEIIYLNGVIEFGVQGLAQYTSAGMKLTAAIKELVFQQTVMGDAFEETAEAVENFRDALKRTVDDAYASINAQRELESAMENLGAAFANEAPEVVANSREMQAAIKALIDTAASPEEAIDGMLGLYNEIINGGYSTRAELVVLEQQILSLYRTATQVRIEALEAQRAATMIGGLPFDTKGYSQLTAEINRLKVSQQSIFFMQQEIGSSLSNSVDLANALARGYSRSESAARGTAGAAKKTAERTKEAAEAVKEIRTLLDYAGDLDRVIKRAFDIRFKAAFGLDKIASSWKSLNDTIENTRKTIQDLIRSQRELAADRAIKQYFLSIANAYGDLLRAAKLREEIAEIDAKTLENSKKLTEQGFAGNLDTDLFRINDDSDVARRNRAALSGLVKEYQDYVIALAESGASQEELRQASEKARAEFIQKAKQLGFSEEAVLKYAVAFDDLTFAINNVPRNITIEADVNPALTALRELEAQQIRNIELANELNKALGSGAPQGDTSKKAPTRANTANAAEAARLERLINAHQSDRSLYGRVGKSNEWQKIANDLQSQLRKARGYFAGGLVKGPGGPTEDKVPAMLSPGEFVIKAAAVRKFGVPFLNQLNQMRTPQFINQTVVQQTQSPGSMIVELSPYDRKLLADAGNVQLRLDGKVVAEATNASNLMDARRGTS